MNATAAPGDTLPAPNASDMPTIKLGQHAISRLIMGANTINGGSHLSRFVNLQMKRYFSPECVMQTLDACEAAGINTWQGSPGDLERYLAHREAGGGLSFISLAHDDPADPQVIARLLAAA